MLWPCASCRPPFQGPVLMLTLLKYLLTLRGLRLFFKLLPISNTGVSAAYILATIHFLYHTLGSFSEMEYYFYQLAYQDSKVSKRFVGLKSQKTDPHLKLLSRNTGVQSRICQFNPEYSTFNLLKILLVISFRSFNVPWWWILHHCCVFIWCAVLFSDLCLIISLIDCSVMSQLFCMSVPSGFINTNTVGNWSCLPNQFLCNSVENPFL